MFNPLAFAVFGEKREKSERRGGGVQREVETEGHLVIRV